jgi:transcriptional regulator with XRE-family HTH domain
MATKRHPETNPAAFLGDELRRARLAAGFSSQDALAAKLGFDRTVIAKAETGERPPTVDVMAAWCTACRLDSDLFRRLAVLARRGNGPLPAWFRDWVTHGEQLASRLRWFEPLVIPGLLQTEAYARSLLTGRIGSQPEEVEARVRARMDRQGVLTREDDPAEFLAVIDEGVLRRAVGGAKVMAEQLEHLIGASGWPNVVIQVIPAATAAHDGVNGGGFAIADFEDGPGLGYQETALRGVPITDPKDVMGLAVAFDRLRAEALPRAASLALLEEALTTWSQAV